MIINHSDIKQPIKVVTQFANENQYGLCPPLSTEVRFINESPEMSASVVNEEGIAKRFSQFLIPSLSGENLISLNNSNSASVFIETITSGSYDIQNTLKFKSLILSGNIKGELSGNNKDLYITTDIETDPGIKKYIDNVTINGGLSKETFIINWEDFYKNNNEIPLGLNKSRETIDKIIIEVLEPFSYSVKESIYCNDTNCIYTDISTKYSTFSIGFDSNLSGIVRIFNCPAISGEIPIIYGPLMNEKKYTLNTSDELKIYKISDTLDTQGKFKITVFYDTINYKNLRKNSIIIPSGRDDNSAIKNIEIFDYTTLTNSYIRGFLNVGQIGYNLIDNDKNFYIYGGATSFTSNSYSLYHTCTKVDGSTFTISDIPNSNDNIFLASSSNNEFGDAVIIGGYKYYTEYNNYEQNNQYLKFNISTETFSLGNGNIVSNILRQGAGYVLNENQRNELWLFGGRDIQNANEVSKTQYRRDILNFNLIEETFSTIGQILNFSEGQKVSQDFINFYIVGGMEYFNSSETDSGKLLTDIQIFEKSTDTISSLDMKVLTAGKSYGGFSSNLEMSKGYYFGGGSIIIHDFEKQRYIDEIDFSTSTICIKCRAALSQLRVGIEGMLD